MESGQSALNPSSGFHLVCYECAGRRYSSPGRVSRCRNSVFECDWNRYHWKIRQGSLNRAWMDPERSRHDGFGNWVVCNPKSWGADTRTDRTKNSSRKIPRRSATSRAYRKSSGGRVIWSWSGIRLALILFIWTATLGHLQSNHPWTYSQSVGSNFLTPIMIFLRINQWHFEHSNCYYKKHGVTDAGNHFTHLGCFGTARRLDTFHWIPCHSFCNYWRLLRAARAFVCISEGISRSNHANYWSRHMHSLPYTPHPIHRICRYHNVESNGWKDPEQGSARGNRWRKWSN